MRRDRRRPTLSKNSYRGSATPTPAQTWLSERFKAVPDALRERLQRVLTHNDDSGHPADVFGRLARITIGEFRGDASRDDALTLLAADAFATYACEAAADLDPRRLADLR